MKRLSVITVAVLTVLSCGSCIKEKGEWRSSEGEDTKPGRQATAVQKTAESKEQPTYEVQIEQSDICSLGRVLVNGFPVDKWGGRGVNQSYDFPVNTALVGEGNVLRVENEPCLEASREKLSFGPIQMQAWVKGPEDNPLLGGRIAKAEIDSAYRSWTERAREKWEIYRSHIDRGALDSMRTWISKKPLTVSATFDNEAGPDFSKIFEEAPRLPDTPATRERLKDFAIRLRDWMAAQDTSALVQAYLPSFWQGRRPLDLTALPKQIGAEKMAEVRDYVVMNNPYLKFDRSDVALRKWSDGRVWELYHGPDQAPLFVVPSMRESSEKYTGIGTIRDTYVAKIGGRLRVVRD